MKRIEFADVDGRIGVCGIENCIPTVYRVYVGGSEGRIQ